MSEMNGTVKEIDNINEMITKEEAEFETLKQQVSAAIAQQNQKAQQEQEKLSQLVEQSRKAIHVKEGRIEMLKALLDADSEKLALPPESAAEG